MSADSSDALKGVPPQTGTISTAINTTTGGISTVHTPHHISQFDADIIGQKIIIDANPPDNIMLKSKKLCIERPEQLAVLDFQAVSQGDFLDSEDKNTKLFNERVLKRNMQLDSVVASMNSAADADPDNYEIAMTQYESALAAAAAEVALLKVAYTFKVYAKVGPSWTSFVKNYSFDVTEFLGSDTEVDATDFGKNFSDYMNGTMYWANLGTTIEDAVTAGKDASLFLQLLLDLSFSCAFCTPQNALSSNRFGSSTGHLYPQEIDATAPISRILAVYNVQQRLEVADLNDGFVGLVRLSRDLTASMQLGMIYAAQGDEDENLKAILEKYVDSEFFTSTTKMSRSMFAYLIGWDHWASCVPSLNNLGSQPKTEYYVDDFKSYTAGLVSHLFTLDKATIIVSTDSDSYQSAAAVDLSGLGVEISSQTYTGVEDLVEAAFSSSKGIDLGLYESTITDFQDNLEDVAAAFKQLFRLLDKRGATLADIYILTENSHPSSPLAIYANVIALMNDRFYTKAPAYIGYSPELIMSSDYHSSSEWYKCWGIFMMIKKSSFAKDIIEHFVDDYRRGFLTFSETSETVVDDNGATYEKRSNVLPGTTTSVDLTNTRGGLYTYLQGMWEDFEGSMDGSRRIPSFGDDAGWIVDQMTDDIYWSPISPSDAFVGTLYPEYMKAQFLQDTFSETPNFDSALMQMEATYSSALSAVTSFQKLNCWWIQGQEDGIVYPCGIIGVAAGLIDAVMTVLYNTLAPLMNIEAAASSDAYFPSVQSTSPPYNTQLFYSSVVTDPEQPQFGDSVVDYMAGFGSASGMNTDYWVPVLNAISEKMTRSEDDTTLFANADIGELLHGIIDAYTDVSAVSKQQYVMFHGGKIGPDMTGGERVPAMLHCERADSNNLAVPQIYPATLTGEARKNRDPWGAVGSAALTLTDIMANSAFDLLAESLGIGNQDWDNIDALISMTEGQKDYEVIAGGWGKYVFGGMKDISTESSTWAAALQGTTAQGSQMLDKIWGMDDWLLAVYEFYMEVAETAGYVRDDPVVMAWGEATAAANDIIDPSEIPANLWFMANASGLITDSTTSYEPIGQILDLTISELATEYETTPTPSICASDTDSIWTYDTAYGNSMLLAETLLIMGKLLDLRDEDVRLGIGFDMLAKYAQRISDYAETAIDGLTISNDEDPSALEILIGELSETSAGIDVLQNLTPRQLNLKQVALDRLAGNPNFGYISDNEIITQQHVDAIQIMMAHPAVSGVEGLNVKTSVIGIPSTLFDVVYNPAAEYSGPDDSTFGEPISSDGVIEGVASPLYGIKFTANMPDYPYLMLQPKMFRFDYELFCLSDVFNDVDWTTVFTFADLLDSVIFTRVRYLATEGTANSSETIVKIDETQKEKVTALISADAHMLDIYANTLVSYLLEKYYKLMLGLSLSEDDLTTVGAGLEIPINEYAIDFAGALASIYADLESGLSQAKIDELFMSSTDIEGLSYNALTPSAASNASISTYSDMVNSFSTEIASGEFGEVESSLFEGFTNAASSRLMSAESMRDKILGAKYFDRMMYVIIDPDEFFIMGKYAYEERLDPLGSFDPAEQAARVDSYQTWIETLETNLIIERPGGLPSLDYYTHGVDPVSADQWKLIARPDEGHLSFASWFSTVVRGQADITHSSSVNSDNLAETTTQDFVIDPELGGV